MHCECFIMCFPFLCEAVLANCAMLLLPGGKQPKTQTSHHNNELNEYYQCKLKGQEADSSFKSSKQQYGILYPKMLKK